ncbi:MAG: hypothetical protein PVF68_06640 [Acidobacteriota bacterium]|jgi:hypothetical protein
MPRKIPILLLVLAVAGTVLAAPAPRLEIRGRIVDASGDGVADVAVRFLQARRDFQVLTWEYADQIEQALVARTDEHGFYEATLAPDPEYRFFWLRFYDPETFDAVRYALPPDLDITDQVRSGRPVIRTVELQDDPRWPEVQAWLERLGPDSPRGKIVRRLGIPDRREQADGVESFWYQSASAVYRFRDGQFIGQEAWAGPEAPEAAGS